MVSRKRELLKDVCHHAFCAAWVATVLVVAFL